MIPLYIFDLDGTLSLSDHRTHLLHTGRRDGSAWRNFYAACHLDPPNVPVVRTMEKIKKHADVWIFSGRSDEVLDKTVDWLARYTSFYRSELVDGNILTMRRFGDNTEDHLLKKSWYDNMLTIDKERLVAVFDDRRRVVDMWRSHGISCFQVAPGDF
jgi:phosphoglycolate phosphatase-like HAD superfamily hydrolase